MAKKTSKESKGKDVIPGSNMRNKSLEKRYQDILEDYYSLAIELSKKEDYKNLEDLIEKVHKTDKDFSLIEQLLSSIIINQNNGKSVLSYSEHHSQNYSKVAKKLGLKKILRSSNKIPPPIKNEEHNSNYPAPIIEKELKRINSEYQSLLIKILELKPELQKRVMKINNFSSNYSTPLIAEAYNYHIKTEDINGTINKIKKAIKEEGYSIDTSISLIRLYEIKNFLNHNKKRNQAQKEWKRLVNLILDDKEIIFHSIKHCAPGNKVKKYVHVQKNVILADYIGSTLIFKIGQKQEGLKREKEAIEKLKKINDKKRLNLQLPEIRFFTQKGDLEYIIMTSRGTNVLDQGINSDPYQTFQGIINQIAKIHKHFPRELLKNTHSGKKEENKTHYSSRLKQKLFGNLKEYIKRKEEYDDKKLQKNQYEINLRRYGIFIPTKENPYGKPNSYFNKKVLNPDKLKKEEFVVTELPSKVPDRDSNYRQITWNPSLEQEFFENYTIILNIISGLKEGVYKDTSLKNWIRIFSGYEGWHDYVSIDYGTLRNSPYQFDLANTLESTDYSIPNYKELLLKHYFALTKTGKLKTGEFEEFMRGYHACAVHKCLINMGNSLRFFLEDIDPHYNYVLNIKEPSEQLLKEYKTFSNNARWNINKLKEYYSPTSKEYNKLTNLENQLNIIGNHIQAIAR